MADFGDKAQALSDFQLNNALQKAQAEITAGGALFVCVECGGNIPAARREALPNVETCVPCQEEIESAY